MKLWRVVWTNGSCYPTLRVACVALAGISFREHDDLASFGQCDRGAKPGDAAANNEKIAAQVHGLLSYQLTGFRLSALGSAPGLRPCPTFQFPGFREPKPRVQSRVIDPIRIDVNAGTRSSPIWIGDGL